MIPVFVSRPAVLAARDVASVARWMSLLRELGMRPAGLDRSEYAPSPWSMLRRHMTACEGAVVFGIGQLDVAEGTWRAGTAETLQADGACWTTPWNQIEAGMAVMLGLPVLVVAGVGVREGVFDTATWCENVHGTPLHGPLQSAAVRRWRRAVIARRSPICRSRTPAYQQRASA